MPDQAIHDLAAQVAISLGQGWHKAAPDVDTVGAILLGPNGARLQVRPAERDPARVAVLGRYPNTDIATRTHAIKVDPAKGPAWLARAIQRRLLPDYLPELARVVERNRSRFAADARRRYNAGELARILPGASIADDGTAQVHWRKPPLRVDLPTEISVEMADDGEHAHTLELRGIPIALVEELLRPIASRIPRL